MDSSGTPTKATAKKEISIKIFLYLPRKKQFFKRKTNFEPKEIVTYNYWKKQFSKQKFSDTFRG